MEKLTITEENYKGYAELFNIREEVSNQNKIKNMKIYTGIFTLSIGIGIAVGISTNAQIGLSTLLFFGGWGGFIKQIIDEKGSRSLRIDENILCQIKEMYPNMNPDVDGNLLYLALEQEGMLVHSKKSSVYASAENFKKKNDRDSGSKVFCK